MRFYEITITKPGSTTPVQIWSSYPNGVYDPGALNVEFDMPIFPAGTQNSAVTLTIEGISLADLNQQTQYAGMTLTIKGGMKAGFPLVNPSQAGVLLSGYIYQSFGNWQGTEQTLDFVVYPYQYTLDSPGNFVFNWQAGQPLSQALSQTLGTAYPGVRINSNISDSLVNGYDIVHFCATFDQLGMLVTEHTTSVFNNPVTMSMQGSSINITDTTNKPSPIQIAFTDLIGQPTWIDAYTMQMKTVMRADIQLNSVIQMPKGLQNAPGIVTQTSAALPSQIKYKSAFQNSFTVNGIRHIGNFRSSDASNWCSIFNCIENPGNG